MYAGAGIHVISVESALYTKGCTVHCVSRTVIYHVESSIIDGMAEEIMATYILPCHLPECEQIYMDILYCIYIIQYYSTSHTTALRVDRCTQDR